MIRKACYTLSVIAVVIFFFYQDILENEDVKLDHMFMASLIADIVKVSSPCCILPVILK